MTEETRQHQPNPSGDPDEKFALTELQMAWTDNVRERWECSGEPEKELSYLYGLAFAADHGTNAQLRLLQPILAAAMNSRPDLCADELRELTAKGGGK